MDSHHLQVSRGQHLSFAANGNPASGIIVDSANSFGFTATVTVEITDSNIPGGAQLTIPDLDCGGCGLAHPVSHDGHTTIEISIPYGAIDLATIGK